MRRRPHARNLRKAFQAQIEQLESRWAYNVAPLTPPINEPTLGRLVNPQDLHMEAGPFSDPDVGDTHTQTQWEVRLLSTNELVWSSTAAAPQVELVHTHIGDGTFQGTHAGRTSFLPDTNYKLRARFRDSSGDVATQYSGFAERNFTTGPLTGTFALEVADVLNFPAPTWSFNSGGTSVILPGGVTPPHMYLETANGTLVDVSGTGGGSNNVVNNSTLGSGKPLKVRFTSGSNPLSLAESNYEFVDDDGKNRIIYLPAISLAANQTAVYWVSLNGSTYVGAVGETDPNFALLARGSAVPWTAPNGYRVEVVSTGYQLPIDVAFVPNPGPNPTDPYYYVAELYGNIKVVLRNGTVLPYASNLLNFNPTGNFPGSGEQGLASIVVDPASGDVFASLVYSSVNGVENVPHYPRIVRFSSNNGGVSATSQTVILNMVGESQGQSHQISSLNIGPDGKLYLNNGDGFDASTALNLESYRGKILRMNLNGTPATDNPFYNGGTITSRDYVYSYGVRNPFGGAFRASDGKLYFVENGPSVDRFAQANAGVSYGWNGSDASMTINAKYNWSPATAPVNITFVQPSTFSGSAFPAGKQDRAFVTLSGGTWATGPGGKNIVEFALDASGNVIGGAPTNFVSYNGGGKATAAGLTSGPDGLYFTDLYKDENYVSPIDAGANVLRIKYVGAAEFTADNRTGNSPLTVQFTNTSDVPGASSYFWEFGDGTTSTLQNPSKTYTVDGNYNVRLTVTGTNGPVSTTKPNYIRVGNIAVPGLTGTYYNNINFTGTTVERIDNTVNFNWGNGQPDPLIGADTFSVRWTGQIEPQFSQNYTFYTTSDDGVRLYVNNQLIINNWTDHGPTEDIGTITLVAGQRYDIQMDFYENGGGAVATLSWSSPSQPKQIIPNNRLFSFGTTPAAPTGLDATVGGPTTVNLVWNDLANNETGYQIERSLDGSNFTTLTTVGMNVTSYSNTGLTAGTTYFYRVRSVNTYGNSTPSNVDSATPNYTQPAAPTSLLAAAAGATTVNLTWVDNANNEDNYAVERSLDGVNFSVIATIPANSINYSDTGRTPGTTYFYQVRAFNPGFSSNYSNISSATPNFTLPAAPSSLSAVSSGPTSINLTWLDNATDEQGFLVERSTDNVNFTQIANLASNTVAYSSTGLTTGVTYYYRVLAYNQAGNSAFSNTASAVPQTAPLVAPSSLVATAIGYDRIRLTWVDNSNNEQRFNIERSANGVNFTLVGFVSANTTSFIDQALNAGSAYTYRVRAQSTGGNSAYSNTSTATPGNNASAVLVLRLDERTGNPADTSGNGNTATLQGGATWDAGVVGPGAIYLPGTSARVQVANNASLNPTSGLGIAAWIRPTSWNGSTRIVQKGSTDNQYRLFQDGGDLRFEVSGVGSVAAPLPALGQWSHVAGSWNGTSLQLYINGVLAATQVAAGTMATSTDILTVGYKGGTATAADAFTGIIDDVRVYNRGITITDARALATVRTSDMIKINFQPAASPTYSDYFVDSGAVFGNRGNGYDYGWNLNTAAATADRNSAASPDQRYDTLIQTQAAGNSNASWRISVPNGYFQVRVVAGDPTASTGTMHYLAEGTSVLNGALNASVKWQEGTVVVHVLDELLDITNGGSASTNKLSFVELNPVPRVDIIDISPDPRNSAVAQAMIVFSEPVTGFDISDISLTRNAGSNLITDAQRLSTSDGRTWFITLGSISGAVGTYNLSVSTTGGITDAAGAPLVVGASDTWVVQPLGGGLSGGDVIALGGPDDTATQIAGVALQSSASAGSSTNFAAATLPPQYGPFRERVREAIGRVLSREEIKSAISEFRSAIEELVKNRKGPRGGTLADFFSKLGKNPG
ncbi:MAG: PA14 domain-containing protein [Pirellulales bacterium]|nr:PA14 domain-containing protein [Pirellulales bacterium]